MRKSHLTFGDISWDSAYDAWIGECRIGPKKVELVIYADRAFSDAAAYESIYRAVLPKCVDLPASVVDWLVADMAHWLDEEEKDRATLLQTTSIDKIEIVSETLAIVWFDGPKPIYDSGHWVQASFGAAGSFKDFSLAG